MIDFRCPRLVRAALVALLALVVPACAGPSAPSSPVGAPAARDYSDHPASYGTVPPLQAPRDGAPDGGQDGNRVEARGEAKAARAARTALAPVWRHGARRGVSGKQVALTFDADMMAGQQDRADAGEQFDNPGLIAALRELKVPATVFMTGTWAARYPGQARAIGRDPLFEVANHSYSHHAFATPCYGLPEVDPGAMRAEVERTFAELRRAGVPAPVPYFRFPGGCYDDTALRALAPTGVTAVQWDVSSGDAFATDPGAVAEEVLTRVRPGSVVVLHVTRSAAPVTEEAVREIVPELRRRGYGFARVSELAAGS
ncbi:polysaccharide deacetylase family protein [Streptomyces aculeolatus]|uniref:polysaccharide deacetylase family protein n=1 Tax=Streptomyces aculeolatus TaxID=270689 RepID=UPI001CEDE8A9|nr:polysaccharide deacetylase family protein [Streptomyces aculeolatus]